MKKYTLHVLVVSLCSLFPFAGYARVYKVMDLTFINKSTSQTVIIRANSYCGDNADARPPLELKPGETVTTLVNVDDYCASNGDDNSSTGFNIFDINNINWGFYQYYVQLEYAAAPKEFAYNQFGVYSTSVPLMLGISSNSQSCYYATSTPCKRTIYICDIGNIVTNPDLAGQCSSN